MEGHSSFRKDKLLDMWLTEKQRGRDVGKASGHTQENGCDREAVQYWRWVNPFPGVF